MDELTIKRVKTGLADPAIGPETIALMLTDACNLSCVYCRGGRIDDGRGKAEESELTTEELFSFFEDAAGFKVKEVNIGGMRGEPFCKKDIRLILRKIKSLGLMGSMTTNGSMLSGALAEEMSSYGWDILLLSLDAPFARLQHQLRPAVNGKEYFHNILEFLGALNDNPGSRIRILVNMVITGNNYKYFPEMVDFVNNYRNIEALNVLRLVDMGLPGYFDLQLDRGQAAEFRETLEAFKREKKVLYAGNWSSPDVRREMPAGRHTRCFTNYYILSIAANGDVLFCPQQYKAVSGLNIRDVRLRDLWLNEHLSFRKILSESAPCYGECCTILRKQNEEIYNAVCDG